MAEIHDRLSSQFYAEELQLELERSGEIVAARDEYFQNCIKSEAERDEARREICTLAEDHSENKTRMGPVTWQDEAVRRGWGYLCDVNSVVKAK